MPKSDQKLPKTPRFPPDFVQSDPGFARFAGVLLFAAALFAGPATAHPGHDHAVEPAAAAPSATPVGKVSFANSGAPAAQAAFHRGLAQLHNFEYEAAIAAFREAQAADPNFAMAYWGEAMAYTHPVWMQQDRAAARAALDRLAPTPEARAARAPTEREKAYLAAVEILYGEGTKEARDFAWSDAMARLHARFPDDVDARAFYALSLLGLAHEGRDVALYMRAAAVLEEAYPANTDHPGVLHYLIHSYDDPDHAPLGLRAARLYADVAPDAGHALHMTSHIFLAMGQWDDTVRVNERAVATVNAQRAARGMGPSGCGHYNEWLVYGELQRGRMRQADAVIEACLKQAEEEADRPVAAMFEPPRSAVRSWSDMALRHLVEAGHWPHERLALPSGGYLHSRIALAYGEVLVAADAASATAARDQLTSLADQARTAMPAGTAEGRYLDGRLKVLEAQAAGIEALRAGRAEDGLVALRRAVELEAALPVEFGPPAIEKPGWELLGDELKRLGRADEARAAYREALKHAPGRRRSVAGAAGG